MTSGYILWKFSQKMTLKSASKQNNIHQNIKFLLENLVLIFKISPASGGSAPVPLTQKSGLAFLKSRINTQIIRGRIGSR